MSRQRCAGLASRSALVLTATPSPLFVPSRSRTICTLLEAYFKSNFPSHLSSIGYLKSTCKALTQERRPLQGYLNHDINGLMRGFPLVMPKACKPCNPLRGNFKSLQIEAQEIRRPTEQKVISLEYTKLLGGSSRAMQLVARSTGAPGKAVKGAICKKDRGIGRMLQQNGHCNRLLVEGILPMGSKKENACQISNKMKTGSINRAYHSAAVNESTDYNDEQGQDRNRAKAFKERGRSSLFSEDEKPARKKGVLNKKDSEYEYEPPARKRPRVAKKDHKMEPETRANAFNERRKFSMSEEEEPVNGKYDAEPPARKRQRVAKMDGNSELQTRANAFKERELSWISEEEESDDEYEDEPPARKRQGVAKKDHKPEPETKASEALGNTPSHLTETRFDEFNISPMSIKALHNVLKYERMTAVQEATFPVILQGKDVLAKARTGTGKTIAFLLPAIEVISKAQSKTRDSGIYAVIVCPTRELAQQAAAEATTLLRFYSGIGAQVVIGGFPMSREQRRLKSDPCQILVGTPGRLCDHIENTHELKHKLRSTALFVLDEADHMLDMGFRKSLEKIMDALPPKRQTLLFSATIPKEVHSMSKIALRPDHVFIDTVGKDSQDTHSQVKQQCVVAPLEKQLGVIYSVLQEHMELEPNYKVLLFCTTARVTEFMAKLFKDLGFNTREIHSRKSQEYRTRVSDEFRKSTGAIILCTSDVSARGVDYPNVTLVIQVGVPSEREQYIHRLGRTGRAGKVGEGLLLLAPWESYFLQKLKDLPINKLTVPVVDRRIQSEILSSASNVDQKIRVSAYQAWLGYYKSVKGLGLDKETLVHYANQFSFSIGFDKPPALPRSIISKMSLQGVTGLRTSAGRF